MIYRNDIELSNRIKQDLIVRRLEIQRQIDAIRKENKALASNPHPLNKKNDNPISGVTDSESFIFSKISEWDHDTLNEVDIVSNLILKAISGGSVISLEGIEASKTIYASVTALERAFDDKFSKPVIYGQKIIETAESMSSMFIWFVAEVFRDPAAAKQTYQKDSRVAELFTAVNIDSFGLPKALRRRTLQVANENTRR